MISQLQNREVCNKISLQYYFGTGSAYLLYIFIPLFLCSFTEKHPAYILVLVFFFPDQMKWLEVTLGIFYDFTFFFFFSLTIWWTQSCCQRMTDMWRPVQRPVSAACHEACRTGLRVWPAFCWWGVGGGGGGVENRCRHCQLVITVERIAISTWVWCICSA